MQIELFLVPATENNEPRCRGLIGIMTFSVLNSVRGECSAFGRSYLSDRQWVIWTIGRRASPLVTTSHNFPSNVVGVGILYSTRLVGLAPQKLKGQGKLPWWGWWRIIRQGCDNSQSCTRNTLNSQLMGGMRET